MHHAWNSRPPAAEAPHGPRERAWLGSPQRHFALIGSLYPRLMVWAALLLAAGLEVAYLTAPDLPRKAGPYRMVLIHVPAAWVSLGLFVVTTALLVAGHALRQRTLAMLAQSIAPTGAMFALMAAWTGSLWGRQSLRHWWDAGLALELVVLLLFAAILLFRFALDDSLLADRISALVGLLGLAAAPVILSSWAHWPAVHRFLRSIHAEAGTAAGLVAALALIGLAFALYSAAMALARMRCVVLERERRSDWVARVKAERA